MEFQEISPSWRFQRLPQLGYSQVQLCIIEARPFKRGLARVREAMHRGGRVSSTARIGSCGVSLGGVGWQGKKIIASSSFCML